MDNSLSSPAETANPINAVAIPIFCFISIIITYLPFRAFKRLGNFPACNIIIVNDIINVFYLVNAIIWPNDNFFTWWPGYGLCDIEAILKFPLTLALATSLCRLTQGMANALDVENAQFNTTAAMKRRKLIVDILLCWLVPFLEICLHYTIQNGRYAIVPVFGCADQLDNSWPIILLYVIWIPMLMVTNLYYAAMILIRLRKHRKNIRGALTTTGSGMAPKKFIKMIMIAFSLLIIYLPVQTVFFIRMVPSQIIPYSWSGIHDPASWDPIFFLPTSSLPTYQYYGWASIGWNTTIFLFFGFNDEAVDIYRGWMVKCGLGKIWPSLKEPRHGRRPGSSPRTSLSSRFDLVGKVTHYFDNNGRAESQAITLGSGQGSESSCKDSQGTFNHIALTNIITKVLSDHLQRHRKPLRPNSSSHASDYMSDIITPSPSPFTELPVMTNVVQPEPIVTVPVQKPGNVFSTFRTHIILPTALFTRSSKSASKPSTANKFPSTTQLQGSDLDIDLEAQHALVTPTVVSTHIWSGNSHSNLSTQNHAPHPETSFTLTSSSHTQKHSRNDDLDPPAPKMGTRAYRECERRQFEQEKEAEKEKMTKVLADKFRADMGLELLADEGQGKAKEGVVVKTTSLERREEDA